MGLDKVTPDEVPVVAAVLAQLEDAGLPPGGHISIDSDLGVGADKPGLGASAAICVATLGALHALAGKDTPTVADCVAAHRAAQDGRGSGYDVATALKGGVVLYRPGSDGAEPTVESLDWFEGLHAKVLFTGQGASTVAMLGRLRHYQDSRPTQAQKRFDALELAAKRFVEAWSGGDVNVLLDAVALAQEALINLDRDGRIGIQEGGHAQLMGVVEDHGGLARTSGAGGGDCVWALAPNEEQLAAVLGAIETSGFSVLEVAYPGEGLKVETVD